MTTTYNDVQLWLLSEANLEQLSALSDLIQMRRKNLGIQSALSFKAGDLVWFDAKRKGIIKGTFIRLMQKNAEVKADSGVTWRVSPQLLQRQTPQQAPAPTAPASVLPA